ncbi:MAG: LemA family protein [Coriobacteriales bacterium]|jgi:LemA protein|nr:LemA family protein [Coriobacteriales bacterium]
MLASPYSFLTPYLLIGVAIAVLASLAVYVLVTYNALVLRRNRVEAQWAQVDVQLTRRADLVPSLVEAVKGYAAHEKALFSTLAHARSALAVAPTPGQALGANEQLSDQLLSLFALVEAYPALQADKSFIALQADLKETEDKIAYARQFYNDTVLLYQDKLQQFPSSVVGRLLRFKDESYFLPAPGNESVVSVELS